MNANGISKPTAKTYPSTDNQQPIESHNRLKVTFAATESHRRNRLRPAQTPLGLWDLWVETRCRREHRVSTQRPKDPEAQRKRGLTAHGLLPPRTATARLEGPATTDRNATRRAALRAALQIGQDDLDAGRFLGFRDGASNRRYLLDQAKDVLSTNPRGCHAGD